MPSSKKSYKDMNKYREYCARNSKKYYRKTQNAVNKKCRYTEKEIQMILDHDIPDMELSAKIGRSVQSIQVKRCKLKGGY